MTNHTITPPPKLVQQWASDFYGTILSPGEASIAIANEAARWGADQQLELDARWLDHNALNETHLKITPIGDVLKEAMRPKPPSLKEQALAAQQRMWDGTSNHDDWNLVRRALEALPND